MKAPSSPKKTQPLTDWEHPEGSGIRISELLNQTGGTVYGVSYQIRIPAKLAGKRERTQRETKAAAERFAEERLMALRKHGQRFSDIPAKMQEEAALACSKFLKDAGLGFLEAAEAALKVLRPAGGVHTVAQVLAELKESKQLRRERKEYRERSWLDYKSRSAKIEEAFGPRPINLVTGADIVAWLRRLGKEGFGDGALGARSVKNYRSCLSELFGYAAKKRYCSENPLARFTREEMSELGGKKNKRASINVLTVEEAGKLLTGARENPALELLPSVILRLFCGLRTEEVVRLDWHDVRWQESDPYIHISEYKAKGRSARNTTIPPNAIEWLTLCPVKEGPLSPLKDSPGYCKRFRRLQKLAGFGAKDSKTGKWKSTWETNDTRHSFGSYHFAKHGNSILTSNEMGHRQGDSVLFNNYRRLTTKAEGERYFSLSPAPSGGIIVPIAEGAAQALAVG